MSAPVLKLEEGKLHKRPDLFGKVFAALIHDLTISDGAIRLYAHMHWRYGANHKMFESIGTMAKALGVTDKVIKQRIAELAAAGWIVVIARRANGKVTSNFYHIFERTKDSRTFRKTYKPAEGETVLPAPVIEARKSRKGVGGKTTHKAKPVDTQVPTVAVVTQVSIEGDTQVSTEGDTQVPTNQTQGNQTQITQTKEKIVSKDTRIVSIIDAWHKLCKSLKGNPFANKTYRGYAEAMDSAGITPADVTRFIEAQTKPGAYWHGKAIPFGNVAENISAWLTTHPAARGSSSTSKQPLSEVAAERTVPLTTPSEGAKPTGDGTLAAKMRAAAEEIARRNQEALKAQKEAKAS